MPSQDGSVPAKETGMEKSGAMRSFAANLLPDTIDEVKDDGQSG